MLERHTASEDITCPFCIEFIPANGTFLGQPTVRCWNCGMTFAAPDSWRDCPEKVWKAFEARLEEMLHGESASRRYRMTNAGTTTALIRVLLVERL